MKKYVLLMAIGMFYFITVSMSQETIEVTPSTLTTPKGEVSSLKVKIYQAQSTVVIKDWQKLLTRNSKVKARVSTNEVSIEGIVLSKISEEPMNVYSSFAKFPWGVELNAAFEHADGFISASGSRSVIYSGATNFLYDFATQQYRKAVSADLSLKQKELKSINSRYDKLMKENTKLRQKISSNSQGILNTEEDILLATAQREKKNEEIIAQKSVISRVRNNPELYKTEQAKLKSLESDRKKILRNIEKYHKKIVSNQVSIQKINRSISMNEEKQSALDIEMRTQMQKIAEIEARLRDIK